MSGDDLAAVIEYWRAIELFAPQPLPKLDDETYVWTVDGSSVLPWQEGHRLREQWLGDKQAWQHIVYCGAYSLDEAFAEVRRRNPAGEQMPDERPQAGESALGVFVVADDGRPIIASAMLANCAWAVSQALREGPGSVGTAAFEHVGSGFRSEWEELVEAGEGDEQARKLEVEGHFVGAPLDHDVLQACRDLLARVLRLDELTGTGGLCEACEIRIVSRRVSAREAYETGERELLNSFYAEDLGAVGRSVEGNAYGEALREYLTRACDIDTSTRVDVERDLAYVRKAVSVKQIPMGRWPSAPEHVPALGQQFAVSSTLAATNRHLSAVNGPPGTGKTVMLRDLLAAIVVERATRIAELEHPKEAFEQPKDWAGSVKRKVYPLKQRFAGFELVLACATNAAAENVSAEIPAVEAIDGVWQEEAHYFADIATNMLNRTPDREPQRQAWAMVSAVLGSRYRNKTFVSKFWWEGLKKTLSDPQPSQTWELAVTDFRTALASVSTIQEERSAYSDLFDDLESSERESARERDLANAANTRLEQAKRTASAREQHVEAFTHPRRERSSLWEGVRALRRATRGDGRLAAVVSAVGRPTHDTSGRPARDADAASLVREVERHERLCSEAQATADELRGMVLQAREQWQIDFPDAVFPDEQWEQPEERERRERESPWIDRCYNEARTELFLAALRLHRAFVEGAAVEMRETLGCATELVSGRAPSKVSEATARAAWQSLFLVVPLVSTTFASFPYLFRHLGQESLGWLLIDEAGQANPQTAVGPIWRAKRVVVVGDPLQLEPIMQLPASIEGILREEHGIDHTWLPANPSVQKLADQVAPAGTMRGDGEQPVWVGAPLNVHRRCENPMFAVVNEIAYENQMINCTPDRAELALPASHWIDVPSLQPSGSPRPGAQSAGASTTGNWIPAEGEAMNELLEGLRYQMVDFNQVFLITPFRDVAVRIARHRKTYPGLTTGTIHTAQGREADVVILILGGNPNHQGARAWAAEKPNLLNVAVSRARRRLYVIGDRQAWSSLPHFKTLTAILEPAHSPSSV